MTTKAVPAKRQREIDELMASVVLPDGITDLRMHVDHTPGGKIPGTDYPNGLGGVTRYGPAPLIRGREFGEPFFLGTMAEGRYAFDRLNGPEGELWHRREQRRRRIAEMEAAEAASEAAAKAEAKDQAKTLRRARKAGVDISEATGGGSSRRERSSAKRSASMRMRVEETSMFSASA